MINLKELDAQLDRLLSYNSNMISDCCKKEMETIYGDESTNFFTCSGCHQACNQYLAKLRKIRINFSGEHDQKLWNESYAIRCNSFLGIYLFRYYK